ncbi:COX15/CtaA family protein [Spirosoma linguale]|uniref:Cytochrome oxidase assembly n=1 Tax=Spirosoma linguale (strain ATCC 33905 / DSM 74 / LMG 10896 / Claus 1) TaxID=504472 RepID=D2QS55_SPILD|nr:cytochrome oxidase assembly [Spirosoma linguale DSM 74]
MTSSNSLINKKEQRFQSLAFLTVIVIYLLILAGGIVRGTGSGMGCPDWPKCFGQWIPPTEISQLPANYQEIYGAKLKGEIEFNAVKTWIEYINRLLGVLSGFLVFATLITSFTYLRKDKAIILGSIVAFLMIGVNGWLGSRVVATELAQYMITLHLLLAVVVVFALLFVLIRANVNKLQQERSAKNTGGVKLLLIVVMTLTLGQIVLGAQVRDALDSVVKQLGYAQRSEWIEGLDWRFYVHRSFSLVLFGLHVLVLYRLRKQSTSIIIRRLTNYLIALVVAEIGTGIIMAYLGVPAVAQPIHLLLAILIVGLQFSVSILLTPKLLTAGDSHRMSQLVQA